MKIGDENIERVIFERTKELLIRYGIKGWNMDDLAKESGMSKRTLYKIIGNKEDLLYKCYRDGFEKRWAALRACLNQNIDEYLILDNLPQQIVSGIDEYIIASSKGVRTEYPLISKMIDDKLEESRKMLAAFFDKLKAKGLLRDNVNSKLINNFINALMSHNVLNSKDKTDFLMRTKDELDFLFTVIRKY